jgi:hypothetical protein
MWSCHDVIRLTWLVQSQPKQLLKKIKDEIKKKEQNWKKKKRKIKKKKQSDLKQKMSFIVHMNSWQTQSQLSLIVCQALGALSLALTKLKRWLNLANTINSIDFYIKSYMNYFSTNKWNITHYTTQNITKVKLYLSPSSTQKDKTCGL